MITMKSKLPIAGALIAESSLVSAHAGGHGMSSWHHYLTSPDHAVVFITLVLAGLGIGVYLVRNSTSINTIEGKD